MAISEAQPEIRAGARAAVPAAATRVDRLVRPDDQLDVTFAFLNMDVDATTNTLVRVDLSDPFTGLCVSFGAQHTVEDTVSTADPVPTDAFDHRRAVDSRVVFELAEGTPYALDALLAFAARTLVLDERAIATSSPTDEPADDVTALELAESLVFSPDPDGRLVAATSTITHADVTELWRARLGVTDGAGGVTEPPGNGAAPRPALRAIWSRPGDPPFARPLDEEQREMIVKATITDPAEPIEADRVWLSSQGAFIDLDGAWSSGDLASYRQRTTGGRDIFVEVVERGFLAPFGHEATVTRVTEREYRVDAQGGLTSVLVQDDYLAVAGAAVTYPAPFMPDGGRAVPFQRVTVSDVGVGPVGKSTITIADGTSIDESRAWVVTRDGADAMVSYTATDLADGDGIVFVAPAVFVTEEHAFTVQDVVRGTTTPLGRLAQFFREQPVNLILGGQPVGWAEPAGPAGSIRPTGRIELVLDRPLLDNTTPTRARAELSEARRPAFYPRVERAFVVDEAIATLVGGTGEEVEVVHADAFLTHGVDRDGNPSLAYLKLPAATSLERQGTGQGLVLPSFKVDTFSQTLGAGVELAPVAAAGGGLGKWDPAEALEDVATLLGNIILKEIVEAVNVNLDAIEGEEGLPRYEVILQEGEEPTDPPLATKYVLSWAPKLKTWPAENPMFVVTDDLREFDLPVVFDDDTKAEIELTHVVPFENAVPGGTEFEATLRNATVRLPDIEPVVAVMFKTLRYHEPIDGTGTLETDIADWRFLGSLEWLEPVRQFISTLLEFVDLEIGPDGINIDVEIPLPELAFGVVGVTNVTVGLGLDIPNQGPAGIAFNLSSRQDPFRITLFGAGGSGSFEMEMVADQLVLLHGSLAVTYELAASIVIASVSLSASVGIDVKYKDDVVTLTAFVELVGNASVLGLVNVTGKVLLALAYTIETKLLKGTAKLTAEVDSLFGKSETSWKETVEIDLGADERAARLGIAAIGAPIAAIAASAASFADRFAEPEWTEYCNAFAA